MMNDTQSRRLLSTVTKALSLVLEVLWDIEKEEHAAALAPLATSSTTGTAPPEPLVTTPRTIGEATQLALVAPPEPQMNLLHTNGRYRLPFRKMTADQVRSMIYKWEHSAGPLLARFNALVVEYGVDPATALKVLRGQNPAHPTPARGAPTKMPRKTKVFVNATDCVNMRTEWAAMKNPTYADLVRFAARYGIGIGTATKVLDGTHPNVARVG